VPSLRFTKDKIVLKSDIHAAGDLKVCLCWQFENAVFSSEIDNTYLPYSYSLFQAFIQ